MKPYFSVYLPSQSDEWPTRSLLEHWRHSQGYSKPLQNWAVFLLLSSSTPFNLNMSSKKRGQHKMPGKAQQAIRKQKGSKSNSREQEKIQSKNKKYTNTSKTDCNSREQKETIMVLFSSFVTTQYYSDIFHQQFCWALVLSFLGWNANARL